MVWCLTDLQSRLNGILSGSDVFEMADKGIPKQEIDHCSHKLSALKVCGTLRKA